MASRIVAIADAVVSELNATTFSQTAEAERFYVPATELKDAACIRFHVVPTVATLDRESRSKRRLEFVIDVLILKKIPGCDPDDKTGELMDFVDEVADHFMPSNEAARLDTYATAVCVAVVHEPLYSVDDMRSREIFASLLRLTFRVYG